MLIIMITYDHLAARGHLDETANLQPQVLAERLCEDVLAELGQLRE